MDVERRARGDARRSAIGVGCGERHRPRAIDRKRPGASPDRHADRCITGSTHRQAVARAGDRATRERQKPSIRIDPRRRAEGHRAGDDVIARKVPQGSAAVCKHSIPDQAVPIERDVLRRGDAASEGELTAAGHCRGSSRGAQCIIIRNSQKCTGLDCRRPGVGARAREDRPPRARHLQVHRKAATIGNRTSDRQVGVAGERHLGSGPLLAAEIDRTDRHRIATAGPVIERERLVASGGRRLEGADRERVTRSSQGNRPAGGCRNRPREGQVIGDTDVVGAIRAQVDWRGQGQKTAACVIERRSARPSQRAAPQSSGRAHVQRAGIESHAASPRDHAPHVCYSGSDRYRSATGRCPGHIQRAIGEGQTPKPRVVAADIQHATDSTHRREPGVGVVAGERRSAGRGNGQVLSVCVVVDDRTADTDVRRAGQRHSLGCDLVRPQVDSPHRNRVASSVKRKRLVATRGRAIESADRQQRVRAVELETPGGDGSHQPRAKIEVIRPAEGVGAGRTQNNRVVPRVGHQAATGVVDRRPRGERHRAAAECTRAVDIQRAG